MANFRKFVKKNIILKKIAYFFFTAAKKNLFNPVVLFKTIKYLPRYFNEYRLLNKDAMNKNKKLVYKYKFPVFVDYSITTINKHYWFQDIYVASKIIELAKDNTGHRHLDIGSRVEGFITSLISAKINLVFADINLPRIPFPNTETTEIDLQNMSPDQFEGVHSVSSLHVIEHLGLGKYGDKIDSNGHWQVFEDFSKVLRPGTHLFLSSPVSKNPGVIFNAGRHLDPLKMLKVAEKSGFSIVETAIVQDDWEFQINPNESDLLRSEYGCLILCLVKK